MRNFKLFNGDLALGRSNRIDTVAGHQKLLQDLRCWLLEPYGAGFMTPNFGSFLTESSSRGFIGKQIGAETKAELLSEIQRILTLYQAAQQEKIKIAKMNNTLNMYSRKEILNRIVDIEIRDLVPNYDGYNVKIVLETADGSNVSVDAIIGNQGVTVATS